MLFLPYSGALDLTKKPLVSYALIVLCVIVHQFQWENRKTIELEAESYCLSLKDSAPLIKGIDVFEKSYISCKNSLISLHESRDIDVTSDALAEKIKNQHEVFEQQKPQINSYINQHYEIFKPSVPDSLDKQLMYYPDDTDIWKMLTATVSHADWLHALSNLLFFFAFATGVEGVINNRLKYAISLAALAFITSVAYSVYSPAGTMVSPTLGLSGVVMGMIGMAAYIMPNARIKVLIWGYRFVNFYYIRVWILAVAYIGLDSLLLTLFGQNGGVNLIAHVSGGLAGFLMAVLFFRANKQAAKEELADEVDYQVSRKKDWHSYDLSSSYGQDKTVERRQVRKSIKEYEEYIQRIYTLVNVHKDADAILLIMTDYSRYEQDYQLLQQVFERVFDWGKSATLLCTGRMLIEIMIASNQYAKAIEVLKKCQSVSTGFILADPDMSSLLVRYAIELKEYEAAYNLVHDAATRYHQCVDVTVMQLREAELCFMYLAKPENARKILKQLLASDNKPYKSEVLDLAKKIS